MKKTQITNSIKTARPSKKRVACSILSAIDLIAPVDIYDYEAVRISVPFGVYGGNGYYTVVA